MHVAYSGVSAFENGAVHFVTSLLRIWPIGFSYGLRLAFRAKTSQAAETGIGYAGNTCVALQALAVVWRVLSKEHPLISA